MHQLKNKWFGECRICSKETNLSTTHITIGDVINLWIKRSCDDCIYIIRESIYEGMRRGNEK
jgi:hypothetical protein